MASKIQDRQEAIRWIREGKTYAWIVEEYKRKYHIETAQSTWSMFRRREGIERRILRDENLMPWAVSAEHRRLNPAIMLRAEARRRAGRTLTSELGRNLDTWLEGLVTRGEVVDYSAERGFLYVSRQPFDTDIVREPSDGARRGRANAD